MKLGLLVDKSGFYMFEISSDNTEVTCDYIKKNMIGWLFHTSNIYECISKLSIEKYFVLNGFELLEIKKEDLKILQSSLINSSKKILRKIK